MSPQSPNDGESRLFSTIAQFIVAGGFTALIDQVGNGLSGVGQTFYFSMIALGMTALMAELDARGIAYPGQKALGRGAVNE